MAPNHLNHGPSMLQAASSASRPIVPTQEVLRIPPPTHRRSQPDQSDPYPLSWSEKRRHNRRQPGSISSEDTASTSWSTQKPYYVPFEPKRSPQRRPSPQSLMNKPLGTARGNNPDETQGQHRQEQHQVSHLASRSTHHNTSPSEHNAAIYRYLEEQRRTSDHSDDPSEHAVWILLYLSFLEPFVSLATAIYTLLAIVLLTISYPILHLLRRQNHHHRNKATDDPSTPPSSESRSSSSSSYSTLLIRTLAPSYRQHLRLLCSPTLSEAHTFDFFSPPTRLILINLVSTPLSIGVSLATWIAAAFWAFTLVMGNPDGTERRDDGRAAVLGVRDWWEGWLLYAIRS